METQGSQGIFATTHWSVVALAKEGDSGARTAALEVLCRQYWPPVYAFIRRRGHAPESAQDLTQEFFARLIEKDFLRAADSAKGRFRTLLLTAVSRFLVNEWERNQAQKRGGRLLHLSLEQCLAEEEFWNEPADTSTPERLYERRWAEALLARVLERLRAGMEAAGQRDRFELLKPCLIGDAGMLPAAELARRLAVSEPTVYSLIHRLRHRFAALLREEIGRTVSSPEEIQDEIRHLFEALSS